MARNNKLLEEAKKIVSECSERDISYIGPRPWYQRVFTKTKFGILAGMVAGFSGFAALDTGSHTSITEHFIKPSHSNVASGEITPIEAKFIKIDADNAVAKLHEENPGINFDTINNQRDVAKAFLGKNNFIALAAEMEGFRGDLHKDPATGLNIGFGYNISKRVAASQGEVVKDLISIGLDNNVIYKIIDIAKKPQKDLTKEIKKFNQELDKSNNQLISIEQGVALLKRTQLQYQAQAKSAFPNTFEKMGQHQQEVLTYAAYKVGYEALSQYKRAIRAADNIYNKKNKQSNPNTHELKTIAKELTFYYKKDGKEMVLDERATLIAHTFVHQDYLGIQIGSSKIENSVKKLNDQKIDFSHLKLSLDSENSQTKTVNVKFNKAALDKFRSSENNNRHTHKIG